MEVGELDLNRGLPACPALCSQVSLPFRLKSLGVRVQVQVCGHVPCMVCRGGIRSSLCIRAASVLTKFEQRKRRSYATVRKGLASASCATSGKSGASLVLHCPLLAERKPFVASIPHMNHGTQKIVQGLFSQLSQG